MDIVKLLVVAGLASSFFAQYPVYVRAILMIAMLLLFGAAWIALPPKGEK